MLDGWKKLSFPECITVLKQRRKSIPQHSFQVKGRYPIVDQGGDLIAGYTDSEEAVYTAELPVIVFGDHARTLKYVDFPFAAGADGTKIFCANEELVDSRFLYYALRHLDIPARGYNRHYKLLREQTIFLPEDKDEQRAIAGVLGKLQAAVETQERTIRTLAELKAATMAKLFREGLRGEKLKSTELGEIPESWDALPIGDLVTMAQYGLSVRGNKEGRYPILRMNCQDDGIVIFDNLQHVDLDEKTFSAYRLTKGDLLFNRTNSHELVGRTAMVREERAAVFASYLVRLRANDRIRPGFLNYYLNQTSTQAALRGFATRAVGQSNISASKLKTFVVPVPRTMDQQKEIEETLDCISEKIVTAKNKIKLMEARFSTMLNQLMTGQVRVDAGALAAVWQQPVAECGDESERQPDRRQQDANSGTARSRKRTDSSGGGGTA